ncbi:MAG: cadherin-like beta sandwich domain-containing protein [Eubacterium sp.]|nr:cadherin-like beta sandwich domain-containing protein [Eubacterium sp.]
MKKYKSRRFMLAALTGLLMLTPVQGIRVREAAHAAQVPSANNSRLSAFDISPGDLSPAFSPDVYEYTSTVDAGVTSVSVQAVPEAAGATIASVEGRDGLQPGANTIKVTCSAQDNTYSVYTITLTVGEAQPDSQEPAGENEPQPDSDPQENNQPADSGEKDTGSETGKKGADSKKESGGSKTEGSGADASKEDQTVPSKKTLAKLMGTVGADGAVTLSDASYRLSNNFVYESVTQDIPSAFVQGSLQIGNNNYSTLYCESAGVHLVYMENTDGNGSTGFYYYDQEQNAVERFKYIGTGENFVVLISAAREKLPDGYQEKIVKLPKGQRVAAYQNPAVQQMQDFYLIYGRNADGTDGWYLFDSTQGTYMRYVQTDAQAQEEPEAVQQRTVSIEKYNLLYNEYSSLKKNGVTIVGALAVAIVVLIIIFTAIVLHGRDDDDETEAVENRRVRKRSKQPEEAISKSSLAAGKSLDEKESKGKSKKITRTFTSVPDRADEKKPDGRLSPQEQRLQENAALAQKRREEKKEPDSRTQTYTPGTAASRTQTYASSEAGNRTQPYPLYAAGSNTQQGRAPQDDLYETTGLKHMTNSQTPQEFSYETGSRVTQDTITYEMESRAAKESSHGVKRPASQNMPYGTDSGMGQSTAYGRDSGMGQNRAYGHNSGIGSNAPYGIDSAKSQDLPYGIDGTKSQDLPYGAESGMVQDLPYGAESGMVQSMPYGADSSGMAQGMPYGTESGGMAQGMPYGPDDGKGPGMSYTAESGKGPGMPYAAESGKGQGLAYGADNRKPQNTAYGTDPAVGQSMAYRPDGGIARNMPYETGSGATQNKQYEAGGAGSQKLPYEAGGAGSQKLPYAADGSVMYSRPYGAGSGPQQNIPYETGGPASQEQSYAQPYEAGTFVQEMPDAAAIRPEETSGQHTETYTAGRRLQRAGVPGSRMQQEMYERDSRLQQGALNGQAAADGPDLSDPVQIAAENMRRSMKYTRRNPIPDPAEEEPAPPSDPVQHDPMDDWEVEEKPAGKKSHRKRRSLIDEDMEIMDLNDL